ncbi:elongator complex protein 4 [Eupeodes corollae]|uniref:elongator complex protein 4 n=1 Tax=Eupeodes corollae TaxID=290404 RepID=UPI0024914DDD|nr:elongator complex protein 4 [Eupeodes corollae]
MSSFRRRLVRPFIIGTKTSPQTGQIITGSGNPALDELLGGGIPMNSIILIEEDKHCIYSKVLCKYFLAEGVIKNQMIFLASLDDSPEEILKKLPQPVFLDENTNKGDVPQEFEQLSQDTSSLRIAWRYNDLPYLNVDKSFGEGDHHFNLLNFMPENEWAAVVKILWDGNNVNQITLDENSPKPEIFDEEEDENDDSSSAADGTSFFSNKHFQNLIDTLGKELKMNDFYRICIPSLGSPLWYDDNFGEDLLKFLTILRAFVQNTQCVCFLTMPMHLIAKNDKLLVPKIRNLVDYAIELESFAGSERETNPAFKEYNGLLHFRKMSAINSLALFQHSDLAFKLRRKKFVIEKFHLPPELGQNTEQDSEEVISKSTPVSCMNSSDSNSLFF